MGFDRLNLTGCSGLWWAAILVLSGCSKAVPDAFIYGAAVAGFQVDPGCPTLPAAQCEDRNSDWYQWVNSPAELSDLSSSITFEPLKNGPGQWELYEDDFDLAKKELNLGAIRMSIEWSRIFPTATDGLEGDALKAVANAEAIEHYHAMFAALRARGLEPLVTLNHYTLPLWLHDGVACHKDVATCVNRGWLGHERIVTEIGKYAAFCATEFGADVDWWATLNEPFAVVLPGFLLPSKDRVNPPGLTLKVAEAKQAMLAMIDANSRMYDAVKKNDTIDADRDGRAAFVGLVYSTTPFRPKDANNKVDVRAAENIYYLYNTAFLDAVIKGQVDADLDGTPDATITASRLDYLGVNYYGPYWVAGSGLPIFPSLSPLTTFDPTSLALDQTSSRTLFDILMALQKRYAVPLYITETGVNSASDSTLNAKWLTGTIFQTQEAIKYGVDVRGYFAWSLIDNYEWNQGMSARFGLYEVGLDEAKTRTPREAVAAYRDIIQARDIPREWLKKYPQVGPYPNTAMP